jgi:hypothetical protein
VFPGGQTPLAYSHENNCNYNHCKGKKLVCIDWPTSYASQLLEACHTLLGLGAGQAGHLMVPSTQPISCMETTAHIYSKQGCCNNDCCMCHHHDPTYRGTVN